MTTEAPLKVLRETVEVINTIIIRLQKLKESNLALIGQMEPIDLPGESSVPGRIYLSPREVSILKLVGQGNSNQQIARALGLKKSYIKTIVSRLYDKLEVRDRGGMVIYAIRAGIVTIDRATQGKEDSGNNPPD